MEPVVQEYRDDVINCAVCGKWQPNGLNLQWQIEIVNWGQCEESGIWSILISVVVFKS